MDKFFRSFLEMKWKIKGEWVSFLDALLFVAITGSSLIMRLALMWGKQKAFEGCSPEAFG